VDLRALRYFVFVARLGGFTRAADALHVAQPALSRQIRKLERDLGVQLLVRKTRGVEPTRQGALLLERAEQIFHSVDETIADVRNSAAHTVGRVTVALPPATGLMLVAQFTRRLRAALPSVTLHLREGVGNSLVEYVLNGYADISVVHNPPALAELEITPLVTERMVLVLPPPGVATEWPQPESRTARLDDAAGLPLILTSRPHTMRIMLDTAMVRRGLPLAPVMEVDSIAMIRHLVSDGAGASVLTWAAVAGAAREGELRILPIDHPPVLSQLAMIRHRKRLSSPLIRQVAEHLSATMTDVLHEDWPGALATSRLLRERPAG